MNEAIHIKSLLNFADLKRKRHAFVRFSIGGRLRRAEATMRLRIMSEEQRGFLTLLMLPARLNPQQTAWYLNFEVQEIPILVAAGLLRPLGNPPENAEKYFALVDLEKKKNDPSWLARATNAKHAYWAEKNRRRSIRKPGTDGRGEMEAA